MHCKTPERSQLLTQAPIKILSFLALLHENIELPKYRTTRGSQLAGWNVCNSSKPERSKDCTSSQLTRSLPNTTPCAKPPLPLRPFLGSKGWLLARIEEGAILMHTLVRHLAGAFCPKTPGSQRIWGLDSY